MSELAETSAPLPCGSR